MSKNKNMSKKAATVSDSSDFCFITVLPDGTEISMNSSDGVEDAAGCRAVAIRVEMLSRGLIGPWGLVSRGAERQAI